MVYNHYTKTAYEGMTVQRYVTVVNNLTQCDVLSMIKVENIARIKATMTSPMRDNLTN
jgi:hypothetical protein